MRQAAFKITVWLLSEIILNLLGMDDLADSVEWLETRLGHFKNQERIAETNERIIAGTQKRTCFWGYCADTAWH